MATWGFSLGSNGTGYLDIWENWNTSTQVSLHIRVRVDKNGGWYSSTVNTTWNANMAGNPSGGAKWSYVAGTNSYTLWEADGTYNKDANGNISVGGYAYINGDNPPNVGAGSTSQSYSPARIGIAPAGRAKSVDTITNNSARFGRKQDTHGLGTSSANRVYYRLGNSGGWTWQTADQSGTGWKYNNSNTLTPNTTYSYFSRHWNNNGDTADTTSSTFKTLGSGSLGTPTNLKHSSVTIPATIAASGTSETNPTSKIEYRISGSGSGWTSSSTSTSLSPSFDLTSLKPNTNYEYRLSVTNSAGTWTSNATTLKSGNPPGFMFILGEDIL